jgi:tetratricopeptide (TPR) repeat protein
MARLFAALLLLSATVARAERADDPDTETARRHFVRATEFYDAQRYGDAVREFEAAKQLKPLPELDYNIGRAYDRLEDWPRAIAAYQQYVMRARNAADVAEVRARLAILRARVNSSLVTVAVSLDGDGARRTRLRIAAFVDGSLALAAAISGASLLGSASASYNSLHQICSARPCIPSDWRGAEMRADAGYALFAVAGAAAIIDIALFVPAYRRRSPAPADLAARGAGPLTGHAF